MKKFIFITLIIILGLSSKIFAIGKSSDLDLRAHFDEIMNNTAYTVDKAVVESIEYDNTSEDRPDVPIESDIRYQHLNIKIYTGSHKGEELTIRHTIEKILPGNYIFKVGDKILLRITEDDSGLIDTVKIQERVRDIKVVLIVVLFVILMLLIGGLNGFKALISLGLSIALIIFIYIPLIISGHHPILYSVLISASSVILTFLILSGVSEKTFVSILGTVLGLIFSGILAMGFGYLANLTGLADDNSISLAYIPQFRNLDYRGILFGTIIIGAIGAIMDVAMSISSALWELKEVHSQITKKEMIKSGMNIGRDIMGSMSNTLILAYVGTTLHLLILFKVYQIKLIEIINLDSISTEIIRAMAGSIGLILTIPITVIIATEIYLRNKK